MNTPRRGSWLWASWLVWNARLIAGVAADTVDIAKGRWLDLGDLLEG